MTQQTIIWTALPRSIRQEGNQTIATLAVFVSPRLEDQIAHNIIMGQVMTPTRTVTDYPDFLDWPAKAGSMKYFVVFNNGQPVQASIKSTMQCNSALWKAIIASDTLVKPYQFSDLSNTVLNVMPAYESHQAISQIYSDLISAAGSLPIPHQQLANHPGINAVAPATPPQQQPIVNTGPAGIPEPIQPPAKPTMPTGATPTTGSTQGGNLPTPPQGGISGTGLPGTTVPQQPANPVTKVARKGCFGWIFMAIRGILRFFRIPLLLNIHITPPGGNFEDRIRQAIPAQRSPLTNGSVSPNSLHDRITNFLTPKQGIRPLPSIHDIHDEYDFHQIVASMGNHPDLLPALGLVIELEVSVPATAGTAGTVQVVPQWASSSNIKTSNHSTQTAFQLDMNGFRSRPEDPGTLRNGYLRIDDTNQFAVMQEDAIGGILKIGQAVAQWRGSPRNRNQQHAGDTLPALRTYGIAVTHAESFLHTFLTGRFNRAAAMQIHLQANNSPTSSAVETLYSEDILRGYRVDVWDDHTQQWHSLHEILTTYTFLRNPAVQQTLTGEGFIQLSGTSNSSDATGQPVTATSLHFAGQLFSWDGWSLSAPRLGRVVNDDYKDSAHPVINVNNDSATSAQMQFTRIPRKGSLPRLRFGYTYRLRIRSVDLSGYSQTLPSDPGFQQTTAESTAPIQFNRYEPISAPMLVLGGDPAQGESVNTIVLRQGDGTAPDITTSTRWAMPPKISQRMAEWLNEFDGPQSMLKDQSGYSLATREAASIEKQMQGGALSPIPGVTVVTSPDPDHPQNTRTLYIKYSGAAPYPVAYLPDPLAKGIRILIYRPDKTVIAEYTYIPANLQWPDYPPYLLRASSIDIGQKPAQPQVKSENGSNVIEVQLPRGETWYASINSLFEEQHLTWMAHWNGIQLSNISPQAIGVGGTPHVNLHNDATQGRMWAFTPADLVTLVNATRTPVIAPAMHELDVVPRVKGSTGVDLHGLYRLHVGSTGKIDMQADWTDLVDDGQSPQGAVQMKRSAHVREEHIPLNYILNVPATNAVPPLADIGFSATHHIGDTHYHSITYRTIGTSRYKEYFPINDTTPMIAPADGSNAPDSEKTVDITNTTPPVAPEVVEILPVFEWDEKPTGTGEILRSRRGSILRVFLRRPWYSSGNGEQLGVIFMNQRPQDIPVALQRFATLWGKDPIHKNTGLTGINEVTIAATDPHSAGFVLQDMHFSEATTFQTVSLLEIPAVAVQVAGHSVQFDAARNLWFADIGINSPTDYFPFVRFALARFQPNSVTGAHLSRVVISDYMQVSPDRIIHILKKMPMVAVTVEGAIPGNNTIEVVIEQYFDQVGGDFGWQQIAQFTQTSRTLTMWQGEITIPATSQGAKVRVAVREYEPIDNRDSYTFGQVFTTRMPWRIVYADDRILDF